ncbi:MAG: phage integrase N-terminal SAM-like domain-containing protein [Gammaproteobacteria bacterium]|nr:phage integrase N-terminal SAM-like domain-containing protein [Gammaproteobacteria bacterium]MCF6261071.1 phage integrase N-terminal SAM-like domain-containing protein [Gammaproteobacteria bacterium]
MEKVVKSPFIESIRTEMRLRRHSIRTEKTYLIWIKQFIDFVDKRHPKEVGAKEVKEFLSWLANERNVAINTQKVALNALVFLYQEILSRKLGDLGFTLAHRPRRLPDVLKPTEVQCILDQLEGRNKLAVQLMYGSGLRISECLRLRVQDIDLDHGSLTVRDGNKDKGDATLYLTAPRLKVIDKEIIAEYCIIIHCLFYTRSNNASSLSLWHKPVNHFYKFILQLKTEFMGSQLIYTQLYFVIKTISVNLKYTKIHIFAVSRKP